MQSWIFARRTAVIGSLVILSMALGCRPLYSRAPSSIPVKPVLKKNKALIYFRDSVLNRSVFHAVILQPNQQALILIFYNRPVDDSIVCSQLVIRDPQLVKTFLAHPNGVNDLATQNALKTIFKSLGVTAAAQQKRPDAKIVKGSTFQAINSYRINRDNLSIRFAFSPSLAQTLKPFLSTRNYAAIQHIENSIINRKKRPVIRAAVKHQPIL